jgi:hypothetical protein
MRNTFTGLLTAALIAIASNGIADENNVTQLITEIQKQDSYFLIIQPEEESRVVLYSITDLGRHGGKGQMSTCSDQPHLVRITYLTDDLTLYKFDDCEGDGVIDHYTPGYSTSTLQKAVDALRQGMGSKTLPPANNLLHI